MFRSVLSLVCIAVLISGCGGSNGSDGILITGTLIQGETGGHGSALRHGADQPLENILICALGGCATTDTEGGFGFLLGELPDNGEFLLEISGHGLDTVTTVSVPRSAQDVVLELLRTGTNEVSVESVTLDGEPPHNDEEHHD